MRFRQITSAIQKRRYFDMRRENGRFSWLARNLALYIAGGYQTDGKTPNTALEQAQEIGFDDIERAFLGAQEPEAKQGNAPGSYERLMGGFAQLEARGKTL